MAPPVFLEDFGAFTTGSGADPDGQAPSEPGAPPLPGLTPELRESIRLEGYEAGYKSGWEDCAKSEAEDQSRIGAEFARNLQDLGFTFHEARSHVMHALEPLLTGLVDHVLPRLVAETIGQTIVEELLPLANSAAEAPIDVVISPGSRAAIEPMLRSAVSLPIAVIEEPTLAEGQVFIRSGKHERNIDFKASLERVMTAIDALYELNEKAV